MAGQATPQPDSVNAIRHERGALSISAFAIYVAAFFVVWSLRAMVFIHIDESIKSEVWKNVYSNAVKFVIWVVPAFITLWVWRLRPFTCLKLTITDLIDVLLLGSLFGWVMKKTNSLWPAIGAHVANNFLSGLIHA